MCYENRDPISLVLVLLFPKSDPDCQVTLVREYERFEVAPFLI